MSSPVIEFPLFKENDEEACIKGRIIQAITPILEAGGNSKFAPKKCANQKDQILEIWSNGFKHFILKGSLVQTEPKSELILLTGGIAPHEFR